MWLCRLDQHGNYDIYAHHVLSTGAVDATWPADGRALCTAANDQHYPTIVSDGAGGAIVTWHDHRTGTADIYAQHVLSTGAVDGAWPADGRALCTAAGHQQFPTIVADAVGGAIVTWQDPRDGTLDIYAQRVGAGGSIGGDYTITATSGSNGLILPSGSFVLPAAANASRITGISWRAK